MACLAREYAVLIFDAMYVNNYFVLLFSLFDFEMEHVMFVYCNTCINICPTFMLNYQIV